MTHPNPNLPQIDEEAIKEMVTKNMMESMARAMQQPDVSPAVDVQAQPSPPKYPEDQVTTNELDVEDTLRMENFLLKQQVESLTRDLENARREKAERNLKDHRKGLEDFLVEKHEVDSDKFQIRLDPNSYTLSIIPLGLQSGVGTNNKGG